MVYMINFRPNGEVNIPMKPRKPNDLYLCPIPTVALILILTAATVLSALSVMFPLLALPTATGLLAFVIMRKARREAALIALPAYLLALLLCGNPLSALVALLPVAPALLCAKNVRFYSRSASCAVTAAALAAGILVIAAISFLTNVGSLSIESMRAFLNDQTTELAAALAESVNAGLTTLPEELAAEQTTISPDSIKTILDSTLPLIPGYFAAGVYALSYVAHLILSMLCTIIGPNELSLDSRWMRPSFISACVFSAAYLMVMLFSAAATDTTVFLILCRNLIVILTLPFALCGIGSICHRRHAPLTVPLMILAAIFFLLISPAALFGAAALLGVIDTFIRYFTTYVGPHDLDSL